MGMSHKAALRLRFSIPVAMILWVSVNVEYLLS